MPFSMDDTSVVDGDGTHIARRPGAVVHRKLYADRVGGWCNGGTVTHAMTEPIKTAPDVSPVLRAMRLGQHLLFAVLLGVGAIRGLQQVGSPGLLLVGVLAFGGWYALGASVARRTAAEPAAIGWLLVLVLGWLGLVLASADFGWVAFSLFFVCLHLLPTRYAVAVVVGLTAVVVVAQLSEGPDDATPKVLGPAVGATVAVAMALAYRRLVLENSERRRLVAQLVEAQDDLVAVHDELAASQHEAGVLAERARLARDIHDTLAQGFSSILLLARSTQGTPTPGVVEQIESTARDNLEEARRVVNALAPAALADVPLHTALERLAQRHRDAVGARVTTIVDGEPRRLQTQHEVALLRLAQGALANVRTHARADRVAVSLSYRVDEVVLDVVDDGVGFDLARLEQAPLGGTGFGLRAMRERVADLGGRLVVESAPGEGTAVAATVPQPRP